MPNPNPKRPPNIKEIGLVKHITMQGWDGDLFVELVDLGITAGNIRTALKNRRGTPTGPAINTVKNWIDIWLAEHPIKEVDV